MASAQVQSKGAGTMKIKVRNSESEFIGQIPHVQWVPDIYTCLLAPAQLIKDGFCINLHESSCTILDSDNCQLTSVHEVGNIYPVDLCHSSVQHHHDRWIGTDFQRPAGVTQRNPNGYGSKTYL